MYSFILYDKRFVLREKHNQNQAENITMTLRGFFIYVAPDFLKKEIIKMGGQEGGTMGLGGRKGEVEASRF